MGLTLAEMLAVRRGLGAPEVTVELPGKVLRCLSCAHRCKIPPGRDGICRVRSNVDGKLMVPRGYVAGIQVDPIEKKPFFHALPGNDALSFGMLGCDLHCAYCFPADVRVATPGGMRPIGELFDEGSPDPNGTDGRRVPAPNLEVIADDGSRRAARWIFRHAFKGELVAVKTRLLPGLEATPDHPVLASVGPGDEEPRFVPAAELRPGMFLVLPRRSSVEKSIESLETAAFLRPHLGTVRGRRAIAPETVTRILELSAAGVSSAEVGRTLNLRADSVRHIRTRVRRHGGDPGWAQTYTEKLVLEADRVRFGQERRPGIPQNLPVDAALAELLGLYVAEGSSLKSQARPNSRSLVFAFGVHEEHLAKRASDLIRAVLGLESRESVRETTRTVTIGKSSAAIVFAELCGRGARAKRVPEAIFSAPPEVASAFLAAVVKGDGHRYADGKVTVTTVSERLAWDLVWLALRLGFLPSLYVHEQSTSAKIQGRGVKRSPRQFTLVWREKETKRRSWRSDDRFWYVPIREVTRRPYEGWVYNLEAEGRHTYLANGFAVHNCQNWVSSQALRDPVAGAAPKDVTPTQLVEIALRENAPVVVSTYNEPLITSEWAVEVLKPAKEAGLLGAFVSNGNATSEVLDFIRPYVSLYKIDLKSFNDKRYRELGAPLEHILDGIRLVHAKGFWLEIVTLVIPGFNDSEAELREAARFIRSVSPDIPWHITGFHDDYKMDSQGDTPVRTLIRAAEIGVEEGLRFVYAGNRPGQVGEWEDTRCPSCRKTLIRRRSFKILECAIGRDGACPSCGTKIPGVWDHPLAARRPDSAPATPRRVR